MTEEPTWSAPLKFRSSCLELQDELGGVEVSTATVTYRNYAQHLDRSLEAAAKSPQVIRESGHYLSHIVNVKSIDDFMSNKRVLRYALTAFGLSDISYATALVRRLLEGGIDDTNALANRFTDQRYRDFVTAFNFARYGDATTAFDRTQQGTVDRYKRQTLEENVGQQSEGARLALYFQRQAPILTSPLGLLADAALLKVTQTALSLSPYTSNLSIEAQRDLIANRVNIADFKDPAKLTKFLNRFTALWDLKNPAQGTATSAFDYSRPSIGSSLLAAIQKINSGS